MWLSWETPSFFTHKQERSGLKVEGESVRIGEELKGVPGHL